MVSSDLTKDQCMHKEGRFFLPISNSLNSQFVRNLPWKVCASSIKKSISKIEQIPF